MLIFKRNLSNFRTGLRKLEKLSFSKVVISAGMPRSGSTLLFNLLRLCLEAKYDNALVSAYLPHVSWSELSPAKAYLFKEHKLKQVPLIKYRANHIFYSYRDIRDAMVSLQLKSNNRPTSMKQVRSWINEYYEAKKCAKCIMFKYENFTDNLEQVCQLIAETLKVKIDSSEIVARLPKPSVDLTVYGNYTDPKTLFHGGHSAGTQKDQWKEVLSEEIQCQLLEEFSDWFQENGYKLE